MYSVLIIDMFHYQDEAYERVVHGFPSRELAVEFARRWVRDSLEELRQPRQPREDLRRLWFSFGEDALVIGGEYTGSSELDSFIDHPASDEERDWQAIKTRAGIH